jgi:uncharacterized membrane protein HdeD (DUF308 family)
MQHTESKYWWPFFIRGCLALLFGVLALFLWPILELGPRGIFFGVFIFIQGVLTMIVYLKAEIRKHRLPVLVESVLGLSIGAFLFLNTDVAHDYFLIIFITWGIGSGLCKVIRSFLLFTDQSFFLILGISGLLSILFNLFIYIQAEVRNEPIVWILSIYFVVHGILMIVFGSKVKTASDRGENKRSGQPDEQQ